MANISGAPTPANLNGTQFMCHPMRDIDHDTMNNWVQSTYIKKQVKLAECMEEKQQTMLLKVAQQTAVLMEYQRDIGATMFATMPGLRMCLFIMARDSLTYEQCEKLVTEKEDITKVIDLWKEACLVKNL